MPEAAPASTGAPTLHIHAGQRLDRSARHIQPHPATDKGLTAREVVGGIAVAVLVAVI